MPEDEQREPEDIIEEAKKFRNDFPKFKEEIEGYVQRIEKAAATQILSGKSQAGSEPEPQKEETPLEYKNRVMENKL